MLPSVLLDPSVRESNLPARLSDPKMLESQIPLVISLIVASVVWGLRLEGRVNTTQQKITDSERLSAVQTEGLERLLEAKFDAVDDRLARIERALNGSLKGGH
jgi:hypothetical protein